MIVYQHDKTPSCGAIIDLYRNAGLRRPIDDPNRIEKMYRHSDLVITAWDEENLVGIARSITDFCYSCYLADLAVRASYQRQGIGKQLVELTKQTIGPQTMLLLLSADTAVDYYKKIGMEHIPTNAFRIQREY